MEYLIVLIEAAVALAATWAAWACRGPWARAARGVLVGMAWCAFVHGFCFGVLRVEGPHAEHDPGLLIGFGLVAAVVAGVPVGVVLGAILGFAAWRGERRRAARVRDRLDPGPG